MAQHAKSRSQIKLGAVAPRKRAPAKSRIQAAPAKLNRNLRQLIQANPKLLYLAGGIGAFFLIRFAVRYYRAHPEVLEFIKENIDTVEEKIGELKGSFAAESDLEEARH